MTIDFDPIRTPAFAAQYLGTTTGTLAQYRFHHTKPDLPYCKFGKKVGYKQSVLDNYIKKHICC